MGALTAAFGLFSLSYAAVTLALSIYGFDVAGALGAGLAGARVIPAACAGIIGGRVAARAPPGLVLLGVTTGEIALLHHVPRTATVRPDWPQGALRGRRRRDAGGSCRALTTAQLV